jgi:hypothetical protein
MLTEFEARAADALKTLLGRVSAVKLIELKHESPRAGGFAAILARISINGHSHTLACDANPDCEPARLRAVLREWLNSAAPLAANAIPFVIVPYLSPETQALCKQNKIGYLDFEGNARLSVGDFFIVMRSLPRESATQVTAAQPKHQLCAAVDPIFPNALPKIPQKRPALALSA